jgi:20S proteasome subunit beta 4
MDSLFAIRGKDFVLVVSETTVIQSIFKLKTKENKTYDLDDKILLALSGETADRTNFAHFIKGNVQFMKFKNTKSLTVKETAEFTRAELAKALRKSPYQVNSLLAGFDSIGGAQLYWIDYLGTMQNVEYGAHGYASYIVSSVMSDNYKDNLSLEEAKKMAQLCILALQKRFLITQEDFLIKVIDERGITVVN